VLRVAGGGTLLTGFDGDGLFGGWRWERAASVLGRRARFQARDALRVSLAVAPMAVRAGWLSRGPTTSPRTWLRPQVQRVVRRRLAKERAGQPRRWDRRVEWYARRRAVVLQRLIVDALAAELGTAVRHPFAGPRVLAAVAGRGGRPGAGGRTDWMRLLFADLLPGEVIHRPDKANPEGAFWGHQSRRFIDEWNGSGLDESLVDTEALRAAWRAREWLSASLLHAAWLAAVPTGSQDSSIPASLVTRP
jgi:Asparagine synthase